MHYTQAMLSQAWHFDPSRSLIFTQREENIWTPMLHTSLTPCLGPGQAWSRASPVTHASSHNMWAEKSMQKLIMTEAMVQMLKWTCHLFYLQTAADSSVACCNHITALREARINQNTSNEALSRQLGPISSLLIPSTWNVKMISELIEILCMYTFIKGQNQRISISDK